MSDATTAPSRSRLRPHGAAACLLLASAAAAAQTVTLAGRMGDKALLVIDGRTQVLAPGQGAVGVTLLRWEGDAALVRYAGGVLELRPGAAAVRAETGLAAPASSRSLAIPAGEGGHFITEGAINGRRVRLLVDTGATLVSIPRHEAERLGIDLRQARPAVAQTAGGTVTVHLVTLATLRLGDMQLANVEASVTPTSMPFVLLGNNVLARFQMRRDSDVLHLELR